VLGDIDHHKILPLIQKTTDDVPAQFTGARDYDVVFEFIDLVLHALSFPFF
jgi:hypothetical protein